MVKAKCIEKIRNKNNLIIGYTLQDNTGYTITVEPAQLKEKIAAGAVEIVNLKLTPSGRLIDKSIEDTLQGYKVMHSNKEASKAQYNKTLMLGVAPILNEKGHVRAVDGNHVIFTDTTNIFYQNIFAENTKAEFNGCKELEKTMSYIGLKLEFKEVIVNNPCVMANIGNGNTNEISITARDIKINHKFITIKTVDEVFKILKNQYDAYTYQKLLKITINTNSLNPEEVFDRTFKILKRQKPSGKIGRRCYDLMVYLMFLNSMWLSTGSCDDRYKQLANTYLAEINNKYDELNYTRFSASDKHTIVALDLIDEFLYSRKLEIFM